VVGVALAHPARPVEAQHRGLLGQHLVTGRSDRLL